MHFIVWDFFVFYIKESVKNTIIFFNRCGSVGVRGEVLFGS